MMHGFKGGEGFMFVFGLHGLFMVVMLLALVFLVMWANKALDKKELLKWTKWLFIVGIIGCVLTAAGMFMAMKGQCGAEGHGGFFKNYEKGEKECPFLGEEEVVVVEETVVE